MTPIAPDSTLRSALAEVAAARGKLAGPASLAVVERTLDRGDMPPLHVHEEAEAFHVLEGSLVLLVGGESVRLERGQAFVAPAGEPHSYRAESESTRYLAISFVQSIEHYGSFLRAAAQPVPASSEPHEDDAVVARLAGANRITVLGPPGTLPTAALAA